MTNGYLRLCVLKHSNRVELFVTEIGFLCLVFRLADSSETGEIEEKIKFSSLSAPTKIEELTAGSDEKKNTAQPRRESNKNVYLSLSFPKSLTKPHGETLGIKKTCF